MDTWLRSRIRDGLELLVAAAFYCHTSQRQQFAVRLDELHRVGLARVDLRWLIANHFLEHLQTEPSFPKNGSSISPSLDFSPQSCFLLTKQGVAFAKSILEIPASSNDSLPYPENPGASNLERGFDLHSESSRHASQKPDLSPLWDPARQELWVGEYLVKRFRLPSPNQISILSAFHEEEWPRRIDDPLPPKVNSLPKRRLHDTIRNLNRAHKYPLLRFSGDGTGTGVLWERIG